jgi:hypothetical protein
MRRFENVGLMNVRLFSKVETDSSKNLLRFSGFAARKQTNTANNFDTTGWDNTLID